MCVNSETFLKVWQGDFYIQGHCTFFEEKLKLIIEK